MKKHLIKSLASLLILLFMAQLGLQAQGMDDFKSRLKFPNKENYKDMLFINLGFTGLSDFWRTDVIGYTERESDFFKIYTPRYTTYITTLRASCELRYNIVEYYDMLSLSVNSPLAVSLNAVNEYYNTGGAFSLHTPIYLQFNLLRNASKEIIDKYGYYVGFGYHYVSYTNGKYKQNPSEYERHNPTGYWALKTGMSYTGIFTDNGGFDVIIGLNPKIVDYNESNVSTKTALVNYFFAFSLYAYVF